MTIFKCKMCGGDLEITPGSTVCECEYCGTQQTLPKLDDDRRANMYDRANHFRRANEFDKAMSMYEKILEEDKTDSEAYWSLVLCRYGIEYVEDPMTHKRVPTVNRAQFTSIFMDEDYKSALEYADAYQRTVYEQEAAAIDEIQKGILAISQNEEPFDVFICYKETGADGRRTRDSVIATDLYHQLTQEGFKVFFARITLEDKLGQEYEPYIFAALNSAKVMVVLGTKPEHFNAVWVKNEWSRFLMLIRNGAKKTLIPAYRDMDPYDLPEEFSHLQAQDMNKLGFMQDLIRGIKKITEADKETPVVNQTTVINNNAASGSVAPLLKRAFMFLEDSEWDSANEYAEKVLDLDPECAKAYVVKLLADRKLNTQAELHFSKSRNAVKLFTDPIENNANYKKALRFADPDLKRELEKDSADNAEEYDRRRYENAKAAMNRAGTSADCILAERMFNTVSRYRDAAQLARQCREMSEQYAANEKYAEIDRLYNEYVERFNKARRKMDFEMLRDDFVRISGHRDSAEYAEKCTQRIAEEELSQRYNAALDTQKNKNSIESQKEAMKQFEALGDYKDSKQKVEECRKRIEEIETEAQQAAKKEKRGKIIVGISVLVIAAVIAAIVILPPMVKYNKAVDLLQSGSPGEAEELFTELGNYKDSSDLITEARYQTALLKLNDKSYDEANALFTELGDYKDSTAMVTECNYQKALELLEAKKYNEAKSIFSSLNGYSESEEMIKECNYQNAILIFDSGDYSKASSEFMSLEGYKDSDEKVKECDEKINESKYQEAKDLLAQKKYPEAIKAFSSLGDYSDSKSCYENSVKLMLRNAKVKDLIYFGDTYWYITSKTSDKCTIISKKNVCEKPYNNEDKDITWEKCSLRTWLNESYYGNFSQYEKSLISKTKCVTNDTIENSNGYSWHTKGGNATEDYIYLLSTEEAESLDKSIRKNGDYWVLRSPGLNQNDNRAVNPDGEICFLGGNVASDRGIRPALTIDLSKIKK